MLAMSSREIRINVRTTREIFDDLKITARLRGLTVSSLVNSLVVRAIREEKQLEPSAFEKKSETAKGRAVAPHSSQKIPLVQDATEERRKKRVG